MDVQQTKIPDSFVFTPRVYSDERGDFLEWYRADLLEEALGFSLNLKQANTSISSKGVVRGIHFAELSPGQAKYVTCPKGAVLDFVIDIRVGSPTFGLWDAILLDDVDRKAVYLSEGLGHAFVSLADNTVVNYLVSDTYKPEREHGINPLDPNLNLEMPFPLEELLFSPKDADAPQLEELLEGNLLPTWVRCKEHYENLKKASHS